MGTRASFWINDPRNLTERIWLGCKAHDGHPENFKEFGKILNPVNFIKAINKIKNLDNNDFANPVTGGWPFPWDDDIFMNDYTYAFFKNKVYISFGHYGFTTFLDYMKNRKRYWNTHKRDDISLVSIPAPIKYDSSQPDSILLLQKIGEDKKERFG
ncbi:MAG: hypothetical protein NUV47_02435 [Patescibacteria group bacterium]|nr:hypothetical protein [Patescibacteria group bacterium]